MSITLYEAIQTLFPVKTTCKVKTVDVDARPHTTHLVENNPNRFELIISNVGDNPVYVSYLRDFGDKEGLLLNPNGGFVSYIWNEDFDIVGWGWNGFEVGGDGIIFVMEIVSV